MPVNSLVYAGFRSMALFLHPPFPRLFPPSFPYKHFSFPLRFLPSLRHFPLIQLPGSAYCSSSSAGLQWAEHSGAFRGNK